MKKRTSGKVSFRKSTAKYADLTERPVPEGDELLRVEDVARIMKRSESSIYRRLQNNELPGHKDGNVWYVFKSELFGHVRSK